MSRLDWNVGENRNQWAIKDGWVPIVAPLAKVCLDNGGIVSQVKEKLGGLRFYYERNPNGDDAFWAVFEKAVRYAEREAERTCEVTGKPGRQYSKRVDGGFGWIRTLSPEVAKELGYVVEEEE